MEGRTVFVFLVAVIFTTQSAPSDVVPNESMQDVVQRLIQKTSQLEKNNHDLETKTAQLEKNNHDLETKTAQLEKKNHDIETKMTTEITNLKSEITRLKTGKIKQSLLPGGYSDFSVEDLQWQSLHMSAAAACRGATFTGGSGPSANVVYPRNTRQTCTQICKDHNMVCDAAVSLQGYMGRVKAYTSAAGIFYNYGCGGRGWSAKELDHNLKVARTTTFFGYCCCRRL